MKFVGHRFHADGHLEVEIETSSGARGSLNFSAEVVRAGANRLVPIMLAAFETARKEHEGEHAVSDSGSTKE